MKKPRRSGANSLLALVLLIGLLTAALLTALTRLLSLLVGLLTALPRLYSNGLPS